MTLSNSELVDALLSCRDDVAQPGHWQQGNFGLYDTLDSPVCALGAIRRYLWFSDTLDAGPSTARTSCQNALSAVLPPSFNTFSSQVHAILDFNDAETTTQRDVVELFDVAATYVKGLSDDA